MLIKRASIKDWILPTVTTFVGVFAAAWLTIWTENAREEENTRMLLEVAFTDACSALGSANRANRQLADGVELQDITPVSEPRIMITVLQDHATTFAEFHQPLARELISRLSVVENDIAKYASQLKQAQTIRRVAPLVAGSSEDQRSTEIIDRESTRLNESVVASAAAVRQTLSRLAFLIEMQSGLLHGNYSAEQIDSQLAQAEADPAC